MKITIEIPDEEIKELDDTMYAYNPTYMNSLDMAIEALKEVQQYREIGTVEEFREVSEKQKAKKCIIDSCPDYTHYKCPSCGKIHLSRYKCGCQSLGRIPRYCEYCGQAIDENLEVTDDGTRK